MLHFLLLIILFQDIVYSITLNCLPNDSCSCRNTVPEVQWEIFCPLPKKIDFTVSSDHDSQHATVLCHDMDTWPFVEIELFKFVGKNYAVKIDHCPLPEWPLSNIIGNVNNETMKSFEISGLTSTMPKLTRRNFWRLPRIAELLLLSNGVVEFSSDALQNLSNLQRIRFSQNEISVFPRGIFQGLTKLQELHLNDNKMQSVNPLLFENLSGLNVLNLSVNRLKSLEPGIFKDLVNLKSLNIASNYLTTLPKNILEPLEKLLLLQISDNEFVSLPQRLLIGNSGLVTVDLSGNRGNLSTLPDEFFGNLTYLTEVYVSGNNLTDLPEDIFVGSPRVEFVDLSRNKLSKLQEKTFRNLKSVIMLDLSKNELNNLPDGLLEGLTCLVNVDFRNNAITSISRNFLLNSIDWESVNFDFNQISEIESWSFSNFTKLREVSLKTNELSSLPENIFWGSIRLRFLDISKNKLTDLPVKLFRDSKHLAKLNLNGNKLKNFPEGIFQGLDKLLNLNLQNNAFTTLPDKVFAQATSLRNLDLQFNRLTDIHFDLLRCLPSLEVVSFSHNFITRIIPTTYSELELRGCTKIPKLTNLTLDHNNITDFLWNEIHFFHKLSLLNLTCNRISFIEISSLYSFKAINIDIARNNITKFAIDEIPSNYPSHLHIGNNPIDCGCNVYQFRKYFVDRSRSAFEALYAITWDHLTCSQPESMVGRPVEDIELETFECELDDGGKPRICLEECDCTRRLFDDTLVANCAYRNLTRAPYEFDGFKGSAIELNLTGNSITEMPFFHEHSWREYKYEKVRMIILSHNSIKNFTFDVVRRNLRVLHLDNNHLTRFHVAVAETVRNTTSLQELALHSNPWSCDGETREAFNILKEKLDRKIGDAFNKTCLDSRNNKNGDEKPTSYITYQMF